MNPSSVYKGKAYVFRVKLSGELDWNSPDLIYGIATEGHDGLSFNRFKDLSVNKNSKYLFTKKVNKMSCDDHCTGEDIQNALDDWVPIGTPVVTFADNPVTWYTVAKAAYEHHIFTDSDAFNEMEKHVGKHKERNTAGAGNGHPAPTTAGTGNGHPVPTYNMLERARLRAKELKKAKMEIPAPDLSQGARQLIGMGSGMDSPTIDVSSEDDWENMAKEEIFRLVDEWRSKAINFEEECSILKAVVSERDNNISELEQKVVRMEDELDATKKAMAGFMATADLKTLEAETVKKASAAVLDGLKPLLVAELQPIKSTLNSTLESLSGLKTLHTSLDNIQGDIAKSNSEASSHKNILLSELQSSAEASGEIL